MSWKSDAFDDEQDDECVEDFEEINPPLAKKAKKSEQRKKQSKKRPVIHSSSIRACDSV